MADPTADDHSLLQRLNALKATNVTLDRSSNALDISSTGIEPAADPPSREDALSARLRTLRNRPSQGSAPAATPSPPPPAARDSEDPPLPYAEGDSAALPRRTSPGHSGWALDSVTGPTASSSSSRSPPASSRLQGGSAGGGGGVDDLDELLGAGASQSLDDILEGLDDLDEDQWPSVPKDEGNSDEEAKVAELLAKLQDDPPFQIIKADSRERKKDGDNEDAADDSEGEVMKREIDSVIAKALDEVHLDETMPPEEKSEKGSDTEADGERNTEADFSLPSAPTDLRDDSDQDTSTEDETSTDEDSSEGEDSEGDSRERASKRKQKGKKKAKLKLPDAPVRIWDPAASTETNFETDIARRMAFLKRLNGPLEMPSVPTFKPEDKVRKGAP